MLTKEPAVSAFREDQYFLFIRPGTPGMSVQEDGVHCDLYCLTFL